MKAGMGDTSKPSPRHCFLLAIALIPAIYAWVTWDHSGSRSLMMSRQFGFQTLAVEMALVAYGLVKFRGMGISAARLAWWQAAALVLIVLTAFASGFMAPHPIFAFYKNVANLIHLLFALMLCSLLSSRWEAERAAFLHVLLAGFAVYLLTVILYIATAPSDFDWMFFGMTAQNIRNLGSHMMTIAAFALGAMVIMQGRWRGAAFIVAAVALALLFWSGSRGPFLGFLLAVLVGCFALPLKRAALLLVGAVLSGVAGAFLSLLHVVPDPRFGLLRTLGLGEPMPGSGVTSGRVEIWTKTFEFLQSMPLWGYGDGQYFTIVTNIRPRLAFPHNLELQLLFQWGWVAGGLALLLILILMWRAFWMTRAAPGLRLPGLMILAAIFGLGHLDGPFYDTLPMSFFAIAAAICLARKEKPPPSLN